MHELETDAGKYVAAASDHYWRTIYPFNRGDENVLHIGDLAKCPRAVFLRISGEPETRPEPHTIRIMQAGNMIEALEAHAIARGLEHDGWKLERNILVWVSVFDVVSSHKGHQVVLDPSLPKEAQFVVEQEDPATGLIGGRLPAWWLGCVGCGHAHEEICEFDVDDVGRCGCVLRKPRTALLPRTLLVGHVDYHLTKAWYGVTVECKSKGRIGKTDIEGPRWDYKVQGYGYGFTLGDKKFAIHVVDRQYGNLAPHGFFVSDFLDDLAVKVRDVLIVPRMKAVPPPDPPQKWSCDYCPFAMCERNKKLYRPPGSFDPGLSEDA